MMNKGKDNIVNRLAARIMSVECKHETVKMISLKCKDNLATNAKVLQVVDVPTISTTNNR